ncbi:MAG TPA: hypothetical protein VNO51_21255 [Ilumatobacteraceae bacterium]|nr:hypothetical protein [Ilumatobacteraceae bacterium]
MSITVVGEGIVGLRITRLLTEHDHRVVARGPRDSAIDPSTWPVSHGDVVILAIPGEHAAPAAQLAELGASVVSVGDLLDDTNELLALDDLFRETDSTLVVGAAMSPGLSGLIARHLAEQLACCDEIHVAVHGTAGPACARQHHRALDGFAPGWHDGEWIERRAGSGRELCWFPEPVGARDCYRAELTDPLLLHRSFPDAARISARVSATRRDRLTSSLPMLRTPHPEGLEGALRVEVRGADRDGGRQTSIAGIAERAGTAAAATAAVFAAEAVGGRLPPGVVLSGDAALDTVSLLAAVERHGVRLQEFTGVAQRT